jgi:hypothetical protein
MSSLAYARIDFYGLITEVLNRPQSPADSPAEFSIVVSSPVSVGSSSGVNSSPSGPALPPPHPTTSIVDERHANPRTIEPKNLETDINLNSMII